MRVEQPTATWAPFPDLVPWIEHRDSAVTFVLAVVDHEGGDVAVYDSDVPDPQEETSVQGETQFVHKVPVGGWSALRYQHVTENVWAENAEAVVEQVVTHLRSGQRLVLLAGDPQSRGLVRSRLEDTKAEVIELESGTRNADGGDDALQQAIREALMDHVVGRQVALLHELTERTGRDFAVATGVDDVADAFVRGQVDTLLVDPAAADELELRPADHPGLVLGDTTPDGAVRADLALVAAAVLTSAGVSTFPSAAMNGEPVAALLRWDQDADTSDDA
jgi:ABC-type amino acid transport substrate-binding protein